MLIKNAFWRYTENGIRYEIETPVETEIVIGGVCRSVKKGKYSSGKAYDIDSMLAQ